MANGADVLRLWQMSNTLTIRIPDDLAQWLDETARKSGVPMGRIVRDELEFVRSRIEAALQRSDDRGGHAGRLPVHPANGSEPKPTPASGSEPKPTPASGSEPEPTPASGSEPKPTPASGSEPKPIPRATASLGLLHRQRRLPPRR
jgi:hypothetical protein